MTRFDKTHFVWVDEPMFDLNSLENYGVDINNVKYKFDLENYSYIVCYGHELERLTYRYIKPIKRKGLIPDALTGKATMSSKNQDNIYIYRIKRKNVVCYFHDMDICTKYKWALYIIVNHYVKSAYNKGFSKSEKN